MLPVAFPPGIPSIVSQETERASSCFPYHAKMRIACLQFAPQVGDVDNNLNRADAVLSRADPEDLDLLVLPELAFSGTF